MVTLETPTEICATRRRYKSTRISPIGILLSCRSKQSLLRLLDGSSSWKVNKPLIAFEFSAGCQRQRSCEQIWVGGHRDSTEEARSKIMWAITNGSDINDATSVIMNCIINHQSLTSHDLPYGAIARALDRRYSVCPGIIKSIHCLVLMNLSFTSMILTQPHISPQIPACALYIRRAEEKCKIPRLQFGHSTRACKSK